MCVIQASTTHHVRGRLYETQRGGLVVWVERGSMMGAQGEFPWWAMEWKKYLCQGECNHTSSICDGDVPPCDDEDVVVVVVVVVDVDDDGDPKHAHAPKTTRRCITNQNQAYLSCGDMCCGWVYVPRIALSRLMADARDEGGGGMALGDSRGICVCNHHSVVYSTLTVKSLCSSVLINIASQECPTINYLEHQVATGHSIHNHLHCMICRQPCTCAWPQHHLLVCNAKNKAHGGCAAGLW